jgi:hypothetical protein
VAWKTNKLWVKASLISNSATRYKEYLNDVLAFIRNVANKGIAFKNE